MKSIQKTFFTFTPLESKIVVYPFIYIALVVLMPHNGHWGDMECWKNWSSYIFNNGLENIYFSGTDYPPLYHYILSFFASTKENEALIRDYIYELKYITLLFEFGSIFLLFKYITKEHRLIFFIFILLNPGFLYNNFIWGQVDGILAFLLLACVISLINRKNTLALLLFVLAINFKMQSIIYFPLVLFMLIYNISDFKGIKYSLYVLLAVAALQLLIIAPFITSDSTHKVLDVFINSVDKYPFLSMNAYNFWYWMFDIESIIIIDNGTWMNVTYKSWGLLAFFLSSIAALLPLFLICISNIFDKGVHSIKNLDLVFANAALITILFFFLNTQMHERYSHYALIFLAAYFAVTNNYFPFLLASFAYFLNMEGVLHMFNFPNYKVLLFNPNFIAGTYLSLILLLYYLIYKNSNFLQHVVHIKNSLLLKFYKIPAIKMNPIYQPSKNESSK